MKKIALLLFLICLIQKQIFANIKFANQSSAIAIKSTNSKVKLNDTSKVTGWSLKSIIKDFGNNTANQWVAENYDPSVVITQDNTGTDLALTNLIYSNSNTINRYYKLLIANSNYLNANYDLLKENIKNNSNALLYGIKNDSNALIYNLIDNREIFLNEIKNNSNAIIKNSDNIKNNINALSFLKNDSNTLLYLTKNNSNALLYGIKNNSNSIINSIISNINDATSLVDAIKNNSNAIIKNAQDINNLSSAIIYGLKNNSNTLLFLTKNNSNALIYGIKNNSNTLIYEIKNNSNALLYGIKNNSNAIVQISNNIKNNSNSINYYAPIITSNSNLLRVTSNSVVYILNNTITFVEYCCMAGMMRANSANISNNSNAINFYAPSILNEYDLVKATSNGLVYFADNIVTTEELANIYGSLRADSRNIVANSNSILLQESYFQTIDHGTQDLGVGNIIDLENHTILNPAGNIYRLNSNIYLSDDHKLILPSGYFLLDGNGHSINFAQNSEHVLIAPASTTITTTNIVFYGFNPNCIELNTDSNLIFGDNTSIELLENIDLNQTWSFVGNTVLNGFGNQISLNSKQDNINILGAIGKLNIKDIRVNGLRENNLHATHNTGSLQLTNCELVLDRDFSFTIGTIKFDQEILITGTPAFIYESIFGSTINSNSTLKFDIGSTFSYAPACEKSINNPTNLIMQDSSSVLFLDGANLYSTNTGLILKNGTLKLDHKNFLHNRDGQNPAQSSTEAINFDASLNIEILPGGNIELMSGILVLN